MQFLFIIVLLLIGGGMLWVVILNLSEPKYNGLLWLNPRHIEKLPNIESVVTIKREPEGQKPFWFHYDWWRWKTHPLYLWYEADPVTDTKIENGKKYSITHYPIKHYNPDTPADYKINGDQTIPYVTPNELYDNTDWACAQRFETVKSSMTEAVKLGIAGVMVIVCVVAIIMLVDEANKAPAAATVIDWLGRWA